MINPEKNRNPTLNELILSDDETYPMAVSPDAERVWDEEVVPLLNQAHEKAARAGMPIVTAGVFDPKIFGTGVLVTAKNVDNLIANVEVCVRLLVGGDPRTLQMLSAAVTASGDPLLYHKFMIQLADAMDISHEGKEPHQLAGEVANKMRLMRDRAPSGPTEVM